MRHGHISVFSTLYQFLSSRFQSKGQKMKSDLFSVFAYSLLENFELTSITPFFVLQYSASSFLFFCQRQFQGIFLLTLHLKINNVATAMSRKQSTQEFHFCFSTMSAHIFLRVTLFLVFCTNNWLLFPVSRQLQFLQWSQNIYEALSIQVWPKNQHNQVKSTSAKIGFSK